MITARELTAETVAVVLAGGKGTRLGALARDVCKPALPFGAAYRNIDFSLSNCVNSGIARIGVATQHNPDSLLAHLDKVWLPMVTGPGRFIAPWPADQCAPIRGYRGTADAVYRNLETIEALGSRRVLVLAGDHVYKMDYRPLLDRHCQTGAQATVACVEVPVEEAHRFGIVSVDDGGRISRFTEKPHSVDRLTPSAPGHVLASMGIYVFETEFLAYALRRDAFSNESRHDFGGDILPSILETARVVAFPFRTAPGGVQGYWRDVGTPLAYWQAHMDLVSSPPRFCLDDPHWPLLGEFQAPIRTVQHTGSPDRTAHALVAGESEIRGDVHRSVLFPDTVVEDGAGVANSVILPGSTVGKGARLNGVIVGHGCRIPDGLVIDRSWSALSSLRQAEPVVVTAADLENRASHSCASRLSGRHPQQHARLQGGLP